MSRSKKLPDDPAEVERLYWEEGMSQAEIAELFGCEPPTVTHYMEKYDIETREYTPRKQVEDSEYLDDIIAGYVLLGKWPSCYEYQLFGERGHTTVLDRWESWAEAIESAKERYEETKEEWPEPGVMDRD